MALLANGGRSVVSGRRLAGERGDAHAGAMCCRGAARAVEGVPGRQCQAGAVVVGLWCVAGWGSTALRAVSQGEG